MALPTRRHTEVQTWSPIQELGELRDRMSRLLETSLGTEVAGGWVPAVDVEETDDAFVVEAELPGVKREDVDVELSDNELSIHGELKERERKGLLRHQTRRVGRFDYRVALPVEVNADDVEATLQEGVLRVQVPKVEGSRPRRIEITAR